MKIKKEELNDLIAHSEQLIGQNRIEDARKILIGILNELDPDNINAANNYALTEILLGNYSIAEALLKQILDKEPENEVAKENYQYLNNLVNSKKTFSPGDSDVMKSNKAEEENIDALNILFVQDAPCIRNYKYAAALKKKGHKVALAYFIEKLSERYKGMSDSVYTESIKITDYKQLWDLAQNYDIIHSHNEPDQYTVLATASGVPVIHDTHDLISLREPENYQLKYFEGIANRSADGRIYSTPYQYEEAKNLYGVNGKSIIFYNYASEDHLPKKFLPKLSEKDGKVHFVYEGGISGADGKHRDFADQFVKISDYGCIIHVYPAKYDHRLAYFFSNYPNIIYNNPISPEILIETMTQFDFGLIPWNLDKGNERFLSSTIANKLYEYLAAGLPVATADIISYRDFFSNYPVGVTFKSIEELVSKSDELNEIKKNFKKEKLVFTYENEIERLEEFYRVVISSKKSKASRNINGQDTIQEKDVKLNSELYKLAKNSLFELSKWIGKNGWAGYDPYDAEDFIIKMKKAGQPLSVETIEQIRFLNEIEPLKLRTQCNIQKKINAKGLGLLMSSYIVLSNVLNDPVYLNKAKEIANWLLKNKSEYTKHFSWGYPFDWQSVIFIPQGTPSVVVSTIVGEGFWKLYETTLDKSYLEICISICRFIAEDLNIEYIDNDKICFSYTPIDKYQVHNANLYAAEFLIKIGKEIENENYLSLGQKAANFTLSEQNDDGSIFYWSKAQNQINPKHLDSYHSGFEIRMIYSIFNLTGEKKYEKAYKKYLSFYLQKFVKNDGRVLQFLPEKNPSQINIHGVAEAVLLCSCLLPENPDLENTLERILRWTTSNFQHEEGWFGYLIKEDRKIMIPYLRWSEAWIMRGLSEYLSSSKIVSGEWGFYRTFNGVPGIKANSGLQNSFKNQLEDLKNLSLQYLSLGDGQFPEFIIEKLNKILGKDLDIVSWITLIKDDTKWFDFINKLPGEVSSTETNIIEKVRNYKDYQISMPATPGFRYGSYEWSEYLYKNSKGDPWGQDWRASQLVRYKKSIELLNRYTEKQRIADVLDIGCATGIFLRMLEENSLGKNLTGVDISEEAVKKAKKKFPQFSFSVSSLPHLNKLDAGFDLISALEVIYYVSEGELEKTLLRLKSMLKNNGYLLISIYLNQPPFFNSQNFRKFIGRRFSIISEEVRYHKPYYKYEIPVREVMQNIETEMNYFDAETKKDAENFLQSSFNLLSNINIIEHYNRKAQDSGDEKSISHSIILAQKI